MEALVKLGAMRAEFEGTLGMAVYMGVAVHLSYVQPTPLGAYEQYLALAQAAVPTAV